MLETVELIIFSAKAWQLAGVENFREKLQQNSRHEQMQKLKTK